MTMSRKICAESVKLSSTQYPFWNDFTSKRRNKSESSVPQFICLIVTSKTKSRRFRSISRTWCCVKTKLTWKSTKAKWIWILSECNTKRGFLQAVRDLLLIDFPFSNSTVNQWTNQTTKNIEICKQEIKCAMSLRSYVDIFLKQVVEDISNQFNRTNEEFRNRMEEMRYTKIKLEGLHCGTANQVGVY